MVSVNGIKRHDYTTKPRYTTQYKSDEGRTRNHQGVCVCNGFASVGVFALYPITEAEGNQKDAERILRKFAWLVAFSIWSLIVFKLGMIYGSFDQCKYSLGRGVSVQKAITISQVGKI